MVKPVTLRPRPPRFFVRERTPPGVPTPLPTHCSIPLFQDYYRLVAVPIAERTTEQNRRVGELRAELSRHGVLGYTRRDQLVYDAIDEFLAVEGSLDSECMRKRRDAFDRMRDLWQGVAERRRPVAR